VRNTDEINALTKDRSDAFNKYYSSGDHTVAQTAEYVDGDEALTREIERLYEPCDFAKRELRECAPKLRDLLILLACDDQQLKTLQGAISQLPVTTACLSFVVDFSGSHRDLTVLGLRLQQILNVLDGFHEEKVFMQTPATTDQIGEGPAAFVNQKSVDVTEALSERFKAAMHTRGHNKRQAARIIGITDKSVRRVLNREGAVLMRTVKSVEAYIMATKQSFR
jgi:hypothetical protein